MSKSPQTFTTSFDAIGTHWQISVSAFLESEWVLLQAKIHARIEEFDRDYSRFRPDSWVSTIATAAGSYSVPADFAPLYQLYEQLYHTTNGKVTPLIGNLLVSAGYDAEYSLTPKSLSTVPSWESVMSLQGDTLTTRAPLLLDFGAAGKGYLIDIVCELIQHCGISEYVVDAGGDIRHGTPSDAVVEIGLEHPDDFSKAIGIARLTNQAIAGSAGNRRKWGAFHHIMDPDEQRSVSQIRAVWVIAETALLADGLSTALFFVPPESLTTITSFDFAIVFDDMSLSFSKNFPGELF